MAEGREFPFCVNPIKLVQHGFMKSHPGSFLMWCSICAVVLSLDLGQISAATTVELKAPRERLLLDFRWQFHLGDDWGTGEDLVKAGGSSGPARPGFSFHQRPVPNLKGVSECRFELFAPFYHQSAYALDSVPCCSLFSLPARNVKGRKCKSPWRCVL